MYFLPRTFTYNGTKKPDWLLINKTNRPMFTAASARTLETAGRRGLYFYDRKHEAKEISFDITIMGENDNDLWLKVEWLAGWLDQGALGPLILNDEPDRYYQAVFIPGSDTMDQVAAMGEGTLTFLVPDPFKYGPHFNYEMGNAIDSKTIPNQGNAPIHPLFTVQFTEPSNYFALVSPDGIIQYGSPAAIDETSVPELERVLFDQMTDLVPWTASGVNVDYGENAGAFYVQGAHRFMVTDWGDTETTTGWHGPVRKRPLPAPLQDFRATIWLDLYGDINSMGRVEMWLLDAANQIVARGIMWDRYPDGYLNTGHVTIGLNDSSQEIIIASMGPTKGDWKNFTGRITIRREGTRWRAAITPTDGVGRDIGNKEVYKELVSGKSSAPITQVQISIMKYGSKPAPPAASIREVLIERVNQVDASQGEVNELFQPGDRLEIDTETGAAWKNGEYYNQYLDPGSRFFSIVPGITQIQAMATNPSGLTMTMDYDERYK